MKLYKMTDKNSKTRTGHPNETQWGENVTHKAEGTGTELCSEDVIHAYRDPVQAVMMNPIHANIDNPQLWECEGDVVAGDSTKVGCKELTTLKKIPVPEVTIVQRTRFAILVTKKVYKNKKWNDWADAWLNGKDRSAHAAYDAAHAAAHAAAAAAHAAADKLDLVALAYQAVSIK